jgi:hypothetical protein
MALATVLCVVASAARAARVTFGSDLSATPTLDTADGADGSARSPGDEHSIWPDPHVAEDLDVWNTALGTGSAGAPTGGQAVQVKVKGCAIKDHHALTERGGQQYSPGPQMPKSQQTRVNLILFQVETPRSNGSYTIGPTSKGGLMPFCSHSGDPARGPTSTSTVTSFSPLHLCLARGDIVSFHDIGGVVFGPHGTGWYLQGVPFDVIAPVAGSSMASNDGPSRTPTSYGPVRAPAHSGTGYGLEPGKELMLQVVEGTGRDAYSACPGGKAKHVDE